MTIDKVSRNPSINLRYIKTFFFPYCLYHLSFSLNFALRFCGLTLGHLSKAKANDYTA